VRNELAISNCQSLKQGNQGNTTATYEDIKAVSNCLQRCAGFGVPGI